MKEINKKFQEHITEIGYDMKKIMSMEIVDTFLLKYFGATIENSGYIPAEEGNSYFVVGDVPKVKVVLGSSAEKVRFKEVKYSNVDRLLKNRQDGVA